MIMALDVTCNVQNCAYHNNSKCHANSIKVCNSNCNKAQAEMETQCDTFKCK